MRTESTTKPRGLLVRALDVSVAAAALLALAPLLLIAAVGIRLASRGPVLYRATRAGVGGRPFTMLKLRTMHHVAPSETGSRITAKQDPRVFAFGSILRRFKIDELPQLANVLRGDMAIVGPRPEDASIVDANYTDAARETLEVPPGLTSPGTLWYYTEAESAVGAADTEGDYLKTVLATKLAIDVDYVRTRSLARDIALCFRTALTIVGMALGIGLGRSRSDRAAADRILAETELVRVAAETAPVAAPVEAVAPPAAALDSTPFVSIVIPCRNERRHIRACLDSIDAIEYPKERLEVLVVDGASEDGTTEIIDEICRAKPYFRRIDNPKRITPAALNLGLAAAKGEVIVRMDAHATYDVSYVRNGVELLASTGADLVGGPVATEPGADTLAARCVALATSHPFGVGNSKFRTSDVEGWVDTVPFGAFRREIFDRVGTFDERLVRNQDNELNSRILAHGGRIYQSPRMRSTYFNQATIRGLLSQAWRAGRWNVYTVRLNSGAFHLRHFAPLAFVLGLLGLAMLAVVSPLLALAGAGVLAVYGLAATASAVQVLWTRRDAAALLLPPLFFLYHVAYGSGSMHGLLDALKQVSASGSEAAAPKAV